MSECKEGWYWVRSPISDGAWEVAELGYNKCWFFAGCDEPQRYLFVTEIGPRIPTPDEPWQCVPVEPTDEMEEAALDAHMPFGDMKLAIQAAIVHAPKPEDV